MYSWENTWGKSEGLGFFLREIWVQDGDYWEPAQITLGRVGQKSMEVSLLDQLFTAHSIPMEVNTNFATDFPVTMMKYHV